MHKITKLTKRKNLFSRQNFYVFCQMTSIDKQIKQEGLMSSNANAFSIASLIAKPKLKETNGNKMKIESSDSIQSDKTGKFFYQLL